jgi:hypothetical protein
MEDSVEKLLALSLTWSLNLSPMIPCCVNLGMSCYVSELQVPHL